MDFNNPKEFNDPLVSYDPKGISIGIVDKETLEKLVLHNIVPVSYTHLTLPTKA